ncbi:hypothetical protein DQ04_05421050 [Trypanosoma grayi]|uniref:hypothetical protein n=1 Tax=Trypanosoma grayi TaxID=71804 RepID=UPI0004F40021|nr:hypothetical protein DQ04_05421050 [Trypanosoma grayi]KEG09322.1 hypothetical protein DQ04_05421050 [Trypanosoma grayi]
MSEAEAHLFELLDKAVMEWGTVPVSSLQEACVQVQNLSSRLTGQRRCQLYESLLFDTPPRSVVDTFQQFAENAGDIHKTVAARLKEVFCDDDSISDAELQGFAYHFEAETGCFFDEETTAVTLALATMLVAAELPPGVTKLRRLYQLLDALRKDFMVPSASRAFDGSLVTLFCLLLQYHDPQLSLHLDQHQVNIGVFLLDWVRRLFVVDGRYGDALGVWDWMLIVGDPTLTVYLALSYLIAHRKRFLALQTCEELKKSLKSLVFVLPAGKDDAVDPALHDGRPVSFVSLKSGKSLAQNADIAYRNTPRTTQIVIDRLLYPEKGGISRSPDSLAQYYASHPALPLERLDFAEAFAVKAVEQTDTASLSYIVVDCRARDSFLYAHLPTALHIGDDIGFDSEKFDKVVEMLRDVCGAHLCIFGTGRRIVEELNLLKMLALHFVQCGFPYVSIGGFRTIVPLIEAQSVTIRHSRAKDPKWGDVSESVATLKNNLAELLPHLEFDKQEARRKAEELSNKAKVGVLAAKTWGLNIMQRVSERLAPGSAAPPPAPPTAHKGGNLGATTTPTSSSPGHTDTGRGGSTAAGGSGDGNVDSSSGGRNDSNNTKSADGGTLHRSENAVRATHTFSLGVDEDEEDDFGLITSVPVYTGTASACHDGESLVKGTVVPEPLPPPVTTTTTTTITTTTGTTGVDAVPTGTVNTTTSPAKDIMTEIDEEFDKLFGDSESPSPTGPSAETGEAKNSDETAAPAATAATAADDDDDKKEKA